MRGSPFLRTLIVLAALLVTGLGLVRLTARPTPAATDPVTAQEPQPDAQELRKIPFQLILSTKAESVSLAGCIGIFEASETFGPVTGVLTVGDEIPMIFARIRWADTSQGHRFAKLRLEVPGKPTLEHVFDSASDIDDVWDPDRRSEP